MKTTFILLLALMPFFVIAQKIEKVEVDKFTNQKRILTDYVNVAYGFSDLFKIRLRSVDSTIFLTFYGTVAVGVVGTNDGTMFLMDDKSTFEIFPTSIQSYDIGTGTYAKNSYNHQYRISREQVETLANKSLISIRRTFNKNYQDIDVKEKNVARVKELAAIFLSELDKK